MTSRLNSIILSCLDPRAASIFTRLANVSARPSVEVTVRIGVGVFSFSLAISAAYLYALSLAPTAQFITGAIIRQLALMVMVSASGYLLLLPLIVAGFAAMLGARDVQSESFSLLRLTNISGQALFQGYVIAALVRLRVLLAVGFGVIPMYATTIAPLSLIFINIISASPTSILMGWDIVLRMTYYALIGVGAWGMALYAAVMGVNVGLRARAPILAASIAPIGVIVMMGGVALLLNGYIAPMFSAPVASLYLYAIPIILIAGLGVAGAPYAMLLSALRRTNRPLPQTQDSAPI